MLQWTNCGRVSFEWYVSKGIHSKHRNLHCGQKRQTELAGSEGELAVRVLSWLWVHFAPSCLLLVRLSQGLSIVKSLKYEL